jgi:hypothetical protein
MAYFELAKRYVPAPEKELTEHNVNGLAQQKTNEFNMAVGSRGTIKCPKTM